MTTFTPNFNLDLYEGTDKPDLADQYAAAMEKIDTALQAALEARAELQNSIGTLNINLTATNKVVSDNTAAITANSASIDTLESSVATLKNEVDKNTPLVEEHVNYFAALGVTDDDSANALHTEIDNAYQGVVSNTAELAIHADELKQLNQSAVASGFAMQFYNQTVGPIGISVGFGVNPNGNTVKFFGSFHNGSTSSYDLDLVPIPGLSSKYGYKIEQFHIDTKGAVYTFDWVGSRFDTSEAHYYWDRCAPYAIGSDGHVYALVTAKQQWSFVAYETHNYYQIPMMLAEPWELPEVTV